MDSAPIEPTAAESATAVGVLSALADPIRLHILAVLGDASRCVCEINAEVNLAPNLLSYHLRVLRAAGLVERTRLGRWVIYRVAPEAGVLVVDALAAGGLRAVVAQPDRVAETCAAGGAWR